MERILRIARTTRAALAGGLLLAALLAAVWLIGGAGNAAPQRSLLRPRPTAEPLVPTPLPAFRVRATVTPVRTPPQDRAPAATATEAAPTETVAAEATATPVTEVAATEAAPVEPPPTAIPSTSTPIPEAAADAVFPFGGPARGRVGLGFATGLIDGYEWGGAVPGWWLNWRVLADPPEVDGSRFAQMVRFNRAGFSPNEAALAAAARANPGALWLMGNEPDVAWQDNTTPEQYAATYGRLYRVIKAADPTALVAIAGVSQPTPLRLDYLDRTLAAYEKQFGTEMPVDVWNVHAFILREERDSWGVGIPPGMTEDTGTLYEIADHADLAIFRRQIVEFRRWMAERGLRDRPLVVSEYGILMPGSYGFPPDAVAGFLADTFDFFLTAADAELGYPPDGNRLVQAFCWYSNSDTVYPTPSLFDPQTRAITPVGEMFTAYIAGLP